MWIRKSYVAGGYRLIIGLLALDGLAAQFANLGVNAWRVFDTWTILLTVIYFLIMAIVTFGGWRDSQNGRMLCPMLYGMIIVGNLSSLLLWMVCHVNNIPWPMLTDGRMLMLDILIPIATLLDWLFFARKGDWRPIEPFYFLALPVSFMAGIITTSLSMPPSDAWRFPYPFLNYHQIGVDRVAWWGIIIAAVVLIIGYTLMLLDFALSGKLAQRIVLPKIKTIIIEEEIVTGEVAEAIKAEKTPDSKPANKPKTSNTAEQKTNSDDKATTKPTKTKNIKVVDVTETSSTPKPTKKSTKAKATDKDEPELIIGGKKAQEIELGSKK